MQTARPATTILYPRSGAANARRPQKHRVHQQHDAIGTLRSKAVLPQSLMGSCLFWRTQPDVHVRRSTKRLLRRQLKGCWRNAMPRATASGVPSLPLLPLAQSTSTLVLAARPNLKPQTTRKARLPGSGGCLRLSAMEHHVKTRRPRQRVCLSMVNQLLVLQPCCAPSRLPAPYRLLRTQTSPALVRVRYPAAQLLGQSPTATSATREPVRNSGNPPSMLLLPRESLPARLVQRDLSQFNVPPDAIPLRRHPSRHKTAGWRFLTMTQQLQTTNTIDTLLEPVVLTTLPQGGSAEGDAKRFDGASRHHRQEVLLQRP